MLMRWKVMFLALAALWATASVQPVTAAMSGYCGDGNCDDQPCMVGGGSEACEERSTCPSDCPGGGGDPCSNPSPQWVVVSSQPVGAFSQVLYDGHWYCRHIVTYQVTRSDMQACVSARQPDQRSCFYAENAVLHEPDHDRCCVYYWCGGSGPNCPA